MVIFWPLEIGFLETRLRANNQEMFDSPSHRHIIVDALEDALKEGTHCSFHNQFRWFLDGARKMKNYAKGSLIWLWIGSVTRNIAVGPAVIVEMVIFLGSCVPKLSIDEKEKYTNGQISDL